MRDGEGLNKDGQEIIHEVESVLMTASSNENRLYLGKRYIYWMKRFLESENKDVSILSQALNSANLAVSDASSKTEYTKARHEIDILRAFIKPLFRL